MDDERTVLDVIVKRIRNTKTAMRLLRKLLRNQVIKPSRIVTDRLGSYGTALKCLGIKHLQDAGGEKTIELNALTLLYEDESEKNKSSNP